jgi:hypothetical protein
MKKLMLFFILFLFLSTNLALGSAEQVIGLNFEGNVATTKDGILPATLNLFFGGGEGYPVNTGYLYDNVVITIKISKGDKLLLDKTYPCTVYIDNVNAYGYITSTSNLVGQLSNFYLILGLPVPPEPPGAGQPSISIQVPGDGYTGAFYFVEP